MDTLSNVETRRGEAIPPSVRLAPDTIPEATTSVEGVSVRYVPAAGHQWYVLRASYGREGRAADYIVADGTYAYVARRYARKIINDKPVEVLETLIPNLLFVYTTPAKAREYVRGTPALSWLSYYYNRCHQGDDLKNPPVIISRPEMENFIIATRNHNEHLLLVREAQCHFKGGEMVRVTDGIFKGVLGRVARVAGQQRVIVNLTDVGMISTAYIPSAFLEPLNL